MSINDEPNLADSLGNGTTSLPSPDGNIKCLLIQPSFSENNYWNYVDVAKQINAKTVASPLGLMTVAAILPQHWEFVLVDLNVREVTDAEWDAADLICTGGMLPQQPGILRVVEEAHQRGKFVAVGGPDPTSQPSVYECADALVMGEGEATIPLWLDSWRQDKPAGRFEAAERPDVTQSPIPRFDLISFDDYVHVGIQFSRGCPFHCEFCDIIELYGRIPRSKTSEQIIAELNLLYELGYSGWVDIVDDNFIGNKRQAKPMLVELEKWSAERKFPFYFSTEASMNLADDDDLMQKMQAVDFRFIFMGIETPDPDLLAVAHKRVNSMKPIVERINRIYDHGISISAGFIFGFDNEKPGNDDVMITCIEETGIIVSMVSLLVALPNTQLTRRLNKEGRLISIDHTLLEPSENDGDYQLVTAGTHAESEDNQAAGLNFVTTRDRVEIYREYQRVINTIYSPKVFMDRILNTTKRLKINRRHNANRWESKRELRGFFRMMWWMTKTKSARRLYWRNSIRTLFMGYSKFEFAQSQMSLLMHFDKQSKYVSKQLDTNIDYAINHATYPRLVKTNPLKVVNKPEVVATECAS